MNAIVDGLVKSRGVGDLRELAGSERFVEEGVFELDCETWLRLFFLFFCSLLICFIWLCVI